MKKLYIDFDGVILDTITVSYELIDRLKIDTNDQDEVTKFYQELDWGSMIAIAPVIEDSIECINKMKQIGAFHISILTHVTSIQELTDKVKFLRRYFNDISVIACPRNLSKTKMVDATDAILIDDYSENLREWKKAGGIPIKFSTGKKSREFRTIGRLDEILEVVTQ